MTELYSQAAEQAVLGAMLLDPKIAESTVLKLKANEFFMDRHKKIFTAMEMLAIEKSTIDLITVTDYLEKHEGMKTEGIHYLSDLTTFCISTANTDSYINTVKGYAMRRAWVQKSKEIEELACNMDKPVQEAYCDILSAVESTKPQNDNVEDKSLKAIMLKTYMALGERANGKGLGTETGIANFDMVTGGLYPGELTIIGARPGAGKCLGKGTKVLMYDGTLKKVEEVKPNDLLMGPDSKSRKVISVCSGVDQLYKIEQNKGISYVVNSKHVLSLKRSRTEWCHKNGDILNICVSDYISRTEKFKSNYKGYKVSVNFDPQPFIVEPYFLGLWLGDGNSDGVRITNPDEEVINYIYEYARSLDLQVTANKITYSITKGYQNHAEWSLQGVLRDIGVLNNKHIPQNYLLNSTENRLELLAGLLDSDGYYMKNSNGFEITMKNKELMTQVKFLCDTLGFRTSLKAKKATIKETGFSCEVYRLTIFGNVGIIPNRVERKKATKGNGRVNWCVTGIKIKDAGIGEYYGFELDGDGLFLLEDMTVTHNSTLAMQMALGFAKKNKKVMFFSLEMSEEQYAVRVFSCGSGVSTQKMRTGQIKNEEWTLLHNAIKEYGSLPIKIETKLRTPLQMRNAILNEGNIELVLVDYLQLVRPNGKYGNREQEVASVSRAFKELTLELNIPVVVLSQLNRGEGNGEPNMKHLRESGAIEQDADAIILMHEPTEWKNSEDQQIMLDCLERGERLIKVMIEKQRQGERCYFNLVFRPKHMEFISLLK